MSKRPGEGAREYNSRRLAEALLDPGAAQLELLRAVLGENAQTGYGRRLGFGSVRTLAEFRSAVPLATYEDLRPFVDRMLDGEPDVLLPGQPIFFARTSGTSGKPKHVAYPRTVGLEYAAAIEPMLARLDEAHPGATAAALNVTGKYREDATKSGVPVGSASGLVRNLECFAEEPYHHYFPEAVLELADFEARYYALLRLALAAPLRMLSALNPSTILTFFGKASSWGEALAQDLEEGTLERGPAAAAALSPLLGDRLSKAPQAAARLRRSLSEQGRLVPSIVWPMLDVIQTWKGGAARHYLESLRQLCPQCTLWSSISGSTEGLLLVPIEPQWNGGVPALCSSVLEFFPEDSPPSNDAMVDVERLEEGRSYRVVLTNRRGMYRYVMDDVFRVEGRYQRTPVLSYSHRFGLTSSLTGEKLTEHDIIAGAESAMAAAHLTPTDYQAAPEWGEPARYALLVEFGPEARAADGALFLAAFEEALAAGNIEYRSKRDSGRLGPPELLALAPGEFERMRRASASLGQRSDAQIKVTRLRRELLDRSTLGVLWVSRLP